MVSVYLRRAFADNSPNFPNILGGIETIMKGEDPSEMLKIYDHEIPDVAIKLASNRALYQSRELRTALGFRVSRCVSLRKCWAHCERLL